MPKNDSSVKQKGFPNAVDKSNGTSSDGKDFMECREYTKLLVEYGNQEHAQRHNAAEHYTLPLFTYQFENFHCSFPLCKETEDSD
jgi:hypothetical protein